MTCCSRRFLRLLILVLFTIKGGFGLQCYSCLWNLGGDDNCVNNPMEVKVDECPDYQRYCLVQRQEDALTGDLVSMYRGCTQYEYENGEKPGPDINTFFQSCRTDRCNTGSGKGSEGGAGGSGVYTVRPKNTGVAVASSVLSLFMVFLLI
ncbi:uncharacterized protein LOC136038140 [Artemia franciscana]|uniref:UPAR/Ly6 domain-containing protein n=1 Tax=Artemia franciscana TaxID=6661 RepID=A0AA88I511_ARTSF|nr:hypothetical protein QYM36_005637 [Artemia franciscana]